MTRLAFIVMLFLTSCTHDRFVEGGKRWRDGICQQKYGRDCLDPGRPRRGPPNHNDPLEDLSSELDQFQHEVE
ncbi:MAG: hypothetical protein AAGJ09_08400 [Pseudomonadota bacterium]